MREERQLSTGLTATEQLKAKPIAASAAVGVIASLCCGGSLIFASVGLGVFYSGLGLWRYVPQALAAGAVSIVGINYLFYRHFAKRGSGNAIALREKMFISAAVGLVVMAGGFIFLEWLNHAVVNAERFLVRPEYSQALIKGVPNVTLLYVCATFFALALLWALPFPHPVSSSPQVAGRMRQVMRIAVFGATTILIIGVLVDAMPWNKIAGTASGQHGRAH
jgi:hypothetical protein